MKDGCVAAARNRSARTATEREMTTACEQNTETRRYCSNRSFTQGHAFLEIEDAGTRGPLQPVDHLFHILMNSLIACKSCAVADYWLENDADARRYGGGVRGDVQEKRV